MRLTVVAFLAGLLVGWRLRSALCRAAALADTPDEPDDDWIVPMGAWDGRPYPPPSFVWRN